MWSDIADLKGPTGPSGPAGGTQAPTTPALQTIVTMTETGQYFSSSEVQELVDGVLTNGERLRGGYPSNYVQGVLSEQRLSTDTLHIYWSNEDQNDDDDDEWLGITVLFSTNGGSSYPYGFSTPRESTPVGNQWFEVTPGVTFDAFRIRSRDGETSGRNPRIREIRLNNVPN